MPSSDVRKVTLVLPGRSQDECEVVDLHFEDRIGGGADVCRFVNLTHMIENLCCMSVVSMPDLFEFAVCRADPCFVVSFGEQGQRDL
jgi:hypothetical protein